MRKLTFAGALLVSIVGLAQFSGHADAKVTRLEAATKTPYGSFKSGDYNRWDFRVVGELSPAAVAIPDLEKASRNVRGMVEWIMGDRPRLILEDSFRGIRIPLGLQAYYCTFTGTMHLLDDPCLACLIPL